MSKRTMQKFAFAVSGIAVLSFIHSSNVIAGSTSSLINACVSKSTAAVRIVPSGLCKSTENLVTWSQSGPEGPKGEKGDTGAKGVGYPEALGSYVDASAEVKQVNLFYSGECFGPDSCVIQVPAGKKLVVHQVTSSGMTTRVFFLPFASGSCSEASGYYTGLGNNGMQWFAGMPAFSLPAKETGFCVKLSPPTYNSATNQSMSAMTVVYSVN